MAKVELTLKEYDELKMYKDIVDELLNVRPSDWHLQQYVNGGYSYLVFESSITNNSTTAMRDFIFNRVNAHVDEIIKKNGFTRLNKNITEWDVMPKIVLAINNKEEE